MIFLLAYLYVHYVICLPMVMHMHIKLMNSFGNWLVTWIEEHYDTQAAQFEPVNTHGSHLEHEVRQNTIVDLTKSELLCCRSLAESQVCGQRKAVV